MHLSMNFAAETEILRFHLPHWRNRRDFRREDFLFLYTDPVLDIFIFRVSDPADLQEIFCFLKFTVFFSICDNFLCNGFPNSVKADQFCDPGGIDVDFNITAIFSGSVGRCGKKKFRLFLRAWEHKSFIPSDTGDARFKLSGSAKSAKPPAALDCIGDACIRA